MLLISKMETTNWEKDKYKDNYLTQRQAKWEEKTRMDTTTESL